jgi:hypothetical protein
MAGRRSSGSEQSSSAHTRRSVAQSWGGACRRDERDRATLVQPGLALPASAAISSHSGSGQASVDGELLLLLLWLRLICVPAPRRTPRLQEKEQTLLKREQELSGVKEQLRAARVSQNG